MKDDVLQRVKKILTLKSNSETQFARQIGANQKTINQQIKGERSLSLDTVLLILTSFEDVSAEWLMRGKGDTFKSDISQNPSEEGNMQVPGDDNLADVSAALVRALDELAEMRKLLQEQIKNNQDQFNRFMSVIESLTK